MNLISENGVTKSEYTLGEYKFSCHYSENKLYVVTTTYPDGRVSEPESVGGPAMLMLLLESKFKGIQ